MESLYVWIWVFLGLLFGLLLLSLVNVDSAHDHKMGEILDEDEEIFDEDEEHFKDVFTLLLIEEEEEEVRPIDRSR